MRKNRDIIGLKPSVCVRVGPDPWAELQVDPALGPAALIHKHWSTWVLGTSHTESHWMASFGPTD